MILSLLLAALLLLSCYYPALAHVWIDPDWEEMIKKPEVIALVQVIETGEYEAKVRVLKAFKGSPEEEFWVNGYMDYGSGNKTRNQGQMKPGERYYLFLFKSEYNEQIDESNRNYYMDFGIKFKPRPDSFMKDLKAGKVYNVCTYTSGVVPLRKDGAHYELFETTNSHHKPSHNPEELDSLLRASILFQQTGKADDEYLAELWRSIHRKMNRESNSADYLNCVMGLYLCGESKYHNEYEELARSGEWKARFALARLLGRINDHRASQLLIEMLDDKSSFVQGEVIRQLVIKNPPGLGALLIAHLDTAGTECMPWSMTSADGGKLEIANAFLKLKYRDAIPALIKELDAAVLEPSSSSPRKGDKSARFNDYDATVQQRHFMRMVNALDYQGSRGYVEAMKRHLRNDTKYISSSIVDFIKDHKLKELRDALEDYYSGRKVLREKSYLISALNMVGDEHTWDLLTRELKGLGNPRNLESDKRELLESLIDSLGKSRYIPAHGIVKESFFEMLSLRSVYFDNIALLKLWRDLEKSYRLRTLDLLQGYCKREVYSQVIIQNIEELAAHPEVEPQCKPIIGIFIASDREENIGEIRRNVAKTLHISVDNIGILHRWENIRNKPCDEENYKQIMNEYSYRLLLSHYLDYFAAMKLQGDLPMLKALVESGLAEEWKIEDKVKSAIKAIEGR